MQLWPAIALASGRWLLPQNPLSAAALAKAWLDPGNQHAAGELWSAVRLDPAILIWAGLAAHQRGSRLETPRALAQWLIENSLICWSTPSGDSIEVKPPGDLAGELQRSRSRETSEDKASEFSRIQLPERDFPTLLGDLARHWADRAAESVAEAVEAASRSEGTAPDSVESAYLAAILRRAASWLAIGGAKGKSRELDWLPDWLCQDQAPSAVSSRSRKVKGTRASSRKKSSPAAGKIKAADAAESLREEMAAWPELARQRWLVALDEPSGLLELLACRLSRLKTLEDDFQRTLEIEKLEAMAELAAGAGHEINNPLAIISGRVQLLLREEADPERRRELAVMNSQALRVHEMIADLMLFARPPQPQLRHVELLAQVDQAVRFFNAKGHERGVTFSMSADLPQIELNADPVQLQVLLRAVCENALEAIGEDGHVQVAVRRVEANASVGPGTQSENDRATIVAAPAAPACVEVIVRDSGPGISPEVRRHLFDPFYSGRGAGRGLGMGLAKCWRIVTQHGGEIEVESPVNGGTTVSIRLPVDGPPVGPVE